MDTRNIDSTPIRNPFGLEHSVTVANRYKYACNKKELQTEYNLNWNDYGARNYDSEIGRWLNMNPLAVQTGFPYAAMNNNSIFYKDPTGMAAEDWYQDNDGNYVYDSNITSQQDLTDAGIEGTYLGESVDISVNGGDDVSLNADGSAIDFNWESGNRVFVGGSTSGNAKDNYYASLFGRGAAGDAAMVSYGAAGFASIPFPKSWLANTPSWFHGGYGRGWTKGSKFTSVGSFGYRRLTGGGNAGKGLGLGLARAGNILMILDTYNEYNNFISQPGVVDLWNQNTSNLDGFSQSLINTSAAANGFITPYRPTPSQRQSVLQQKWNLFLKGLSAMGDQRYLYNHLL